MQVGQRGDGRRRHGLVLAGALALALAIAGAVLVAPAHADPVDGADAGAPVAGGGSSTVQAVSGHLTSGGTRIRGGGFDILHLLMTGRTVYPVQDGYRDSVVVTAMTTSANGSGVPVTGTARILRGNRTVKTFALRGARPLVAWNGRDGSRVRPGVYRLVVAVRAANGTTRSATAPITVSGRRLQAHIASVRSAVGTGAVRLTPPRAVRAAQQYGPVTVALRTTAVVHGRARLVVRNPAAGGSMRLPLHGGTHLSAPLPVPEGSTHLTVAQRWAPGTAQLHDLQVVWSYTTLD